MAKLKIAVGLKWVADLDSVDVDPISGAVDAGRLLFLLDPGAESALATALRLTGGGEVTVYTVGGAEMDPALRVALAAGVTRAFRLEGEARPAVTAAHLARAIQADGPFDLVLTGTRSFDRGSAEVPSLLASELGWPVVTDVESLAAAAGTASGAAAWAAVRETERGAKEVVQVQGPAVIALQPDAARLGTASLPSFMAAQSAPLTVRHDEVTPLATDPVILERTLLPLRPRTLSTRARPPQGTPDQRLAAITGGAAGTRTRGKMVEGSPAEAAEAIVTFLRERHLLDAPTST